MLGYLISSLNERISLFQRYFHRSIAQLVQKQDMRKVIVSKIFLKTAKDGGKKFFEKDRKAQIRTKKIIEEEAKPMSTSTVNEIKRIR